MNEVFSAREFVAVKVCLFVALFALAVIAAARAIMAVSLLVGGICV